MRTEYIYTVPGPQRPVFLSPDGARFRYVLEVMAPDEATVQITYDRPIDIRRGKALWENHSPAGGALYGATALRVLIKRVEGWVTLLLDEIKEGTTHD